MGKARLQVNTCWDCNNQPLTGRSIAFKRSLLAIILSLVVTFANGSNDQCELQQTSISAGSRTSCYLNEKSHAFCWGKSVESLFSGSKDVTFVDEDGVPKMIPLSSSYKNNQLFAWHQFEINDESICGISKSHQLFCYGRNDHGKLGLGLGGRFLPALGARFTYVSSPQLVVEPHLKWEKVVVGQLNMCAIATEGSLWCSGANPFFSKQLGNHSDISSSKLVRIGKHSNWKDVSVGFQHICGIKSDAKKTSAWCWGYNKYNQLGTGDNDANINRLSGELLQISAGATSTCGVKIDETLWCWGSFYDFDGNKIHHKEPTKVIHRLVTSWVSVSVQLSLSSSLSCGVGKSADNGQSSKNRILCWGKQSNDAVISKINYRLVDGFLGLGVGREHACYMFNKGDDGVPWRCLGKNSWGQLGESIREFFTGEKPNIEIEEQKRPRLKPDLNEELNSTTEGSTASPEPILETRIRSSLPQQASISAGAYTSCYLNGKGHAFCWGQLIGRGVLGAVYSGFSSQDVAFVDEDGVPKMIPVIPWHQNNKLFAWHQLEINDESICGISKSRDLFCFGENGHGKLGLGGSVSRPFLQRVLNELKFTHVASPQLVVEPHLKWEKVVVGQLNMCAIATEGSLWCSGNNKYKQLGNHSDSGSSKLVRIGKHSNWKDVSIGFHQICGIKSDALKTSASCWGRNGFSQLGIDDNDANINHLSGEWLEISAGATSTCGVKIDETLWCWGSYYDYYGNFVEHKEMTEVKHPWVASWVSVQLDGSRRSGNHHLYHDIWKMKHENLSRFFASLSCAVGKSADKRQSPMYRIICWGVQSREGVIGKINYRLVDGFLSLSIGRDHACYMFEQDDNGIPWQCLGEDDMGQLGESMREFFTGSGIEEVSRLTTEGSTALPEPIPDKDQSSLHAAYIMILLTSIVIIIGQFVFVVPDQRQGRGQQLSESAEVVTNGTNVLHSEGNQQAEVVSVSKSAEAVTNVLHSEGNQQAEVVSVSESAEAVTNASNSEGNEQSALAPVASNHVMAPNLPLNLGSDQLQAVRTLAEAHVVAKCLAPQGTNQERNLLAQQYLQVLQAIINQNFLLRIEKKWDHAWEVIQVQLQEISVYVQAKTRLLNLEYSFTLEKKCRVMWVDLLFTGLFATVMFFFFRFGGIGGNSLFVSAWHEHKHTCSSIGIHLAPDKDSATLSWWDIRGIIWHIGGHLLSVLAEVLCYCTFPIMILLSIVILAVLVAISFYLNHKGFINFDERFQVWLAVLGLGGVMPGMLITSLLHGSPNVWAAIWVSWVLLHYLISVNAVTLGEWYFIDNFDGNRSRKCAEVGSIFVFMAFVMPWCLWNNSLP